MTVKTSIGWCDITVNPIKGSCLNNCRLPDGRAYCYYSGERGIAKRFKQDPTLRLDLSVFSKLPKQPKRIFLCSTNDYWGNWIPSEWRQAITEEANKYPHTYQILTQSPENIDDQFPTKSQVGITITGIQKLPRPSYSIDWLLYKDLPFRFVSFEPLLARIDQSVLEKLAALDWVIIGRLTGYGHKYDPKPEWVKEIVEVCHEALVPSFLKSNLRGIWPSK